MDAKISPCYRCPFHANSIINIGKEEFAKTIQTFGDSVNACTDLPKETKNELIGVINTIVSSYNSSNSIPVVFNSFSKIVLNHISKIESLKPLWEDAIQAFHS